MDDGLEREFPGRREHCATQRNRPVLSEFLEWADSTSPLNRSRHTVGQQQPPGDDIPVPGVDDHINVLIEKIALNDSHVHFQMTAWNDNYSDAWRSSWSSPALSIRTNRTVLFAIVTKSLTEIERQLQEAKVELGRWLAAGCTPTTATELAQREREGKVLTDRLQSLATAFEVQRALASPALHAQERALAKASPKRMKDFGYRPVTVQFLGGLEVELFARYWCRSQARADKGKGRYFGLTLLGVCDRTTPALASEMAQLSWPSAATRCSRPTAWEFSMAARSCWRPCRPLPAGGA
jgi:hypothetical protein